VKRAVQLRNIMTSLGPAYIKLGQALSIRPDLLSPAAMAELQRLCDKVCRGTAPHQSTRQNRRHHGGASCIAIGQRSSFCMLLSLDVIQEKLQLSALVCVD
jgi:hypothetical protein